MIDVRSTIKTKTDQLNTDDVLSPRVITITGVRIVQGDQPLVINFDGDNGKPYKPCLTIRKLLCRTWGEDGSQYIGKSLRLFCDPEVVFGKEKVGGIRVSHMSDIPAPFTATFVATRGKKVTIRVNVLDSAVPLMSPRVVLPLGDLPSDMAITKEQVMHNLTLAAQQGMQQLYASWQSISQPERDKVGGTCPDELKVMAQQADTIAQQMQDEQRG